MSLNYAKEKELELSRIVKEGKERKIEKVITWKEIRHRYVEKLYAENRNTKYINQTTFYLKRMSEFWTDDIQAHEITVNMIEDFRLKLLNTKIRKYDKTMSMTQVDRYMAAGKAAFRFTAKDIRCPFDDVKLYRKDNTIVRYLNDDQRCLVLETARNISEHLYQILVSAYRDWETDRKSVV